MAKIVDVHEATSQLPALLADVEQGTEVVITRGLEPVARVVPVQARPPELDFVSYHVPEPFFDELFEEQLAGRER